MNGTFFKVPTRPLFFKWDIPGLFFLNGTFPASFSLFLSFRYTVDSIQMFNINNILPMTGFKLRTCGIWSDRPTNWATQPMPHFFVYFQSFSFKQTFQFVHQINVKICQSGRWVGIQTTTFTTRVSSINHLLKMPRQG